MGKLRHGLKEAGRNAARSVAPGRIRRFFAELGPGLITGAADDDPSRLGLRLCHDRGRDSDVRDNVRNGFDPVQEVKVNKARQN